MMGWKRNDGRIYEGKISYIFSASVYIKSRTLKNKVVGFTETSGQKGHITGYKN